MKGNLIKPRKVICFALVIVLLLLLFTTTFSFATMNLSSVTEEKNVDIVDVRTLSKGDYITSSLNVSPNTTLPREQGPNWQYGGTVTYSKFFQTLTRSALATFIVASIDKSKLFTVGNVVNLLIAGGTAEKKIIIKEICTYRQVSSYLYEHHHIVEYYKNGVFITSNSFYYNDYNLHGWPK